MKSIVEQFLDFQSEFIKAKVTLRMATIACEQDQSERTQKIAENAKKFND